MSTPRETALELANEIEDALAGRRTEPIDLDDPVRRGVTIMLLRSMRQEDPEEFAGSTAEKLLAALVEASA